MGEYGGVDDGHDIGHVGAFLLLTKAPRGGVPRGQVLDAYFDARRSGGLSPKSAYVSAALRAGLGIKITRSDEGWSGFSD